MYWGTPTPTLATANLHGTDSPQSGRLRGWISMPLTWRRRSSTDQAQDFLDAFTESLE